jgi:hypothetical protein
MPGIVRSAFDIRHRSEIATAPVEDEPHLPGGAGRIEAHRLIETDDEPPDFVARSIASLIDTLP